MYRKITPCALSLLVLFCDRAHAQTESPASAQVRPSTDIKQTPTTDPPKVDLKPPLSIEERLIKLEDELRRLREEKAATQTGSGSQPGDSDRPVEPFSWGDFTWINGGSRQTSRLLDSKYFTPQIDIDSNYTYSLNQPIDNTIVGSTATARHNELSLAFAGIGGDVHVGNVHARIFTQFGTRSSAVPRNDLTVNRGQFDLLSVYRYLSEAYAGYHFDKLYGINVDVGLFFSYVGLFSYTQFENWGYQASFTSDNTPWFFNGARLQIFPTERLKVELWLINGWQTYGKFNQLPGVGYQLHYAPREWIKMVSNGYVGTDTQGSASRVRFHSDSSILLRYLNRSESKGISRAAVSFTFDLGFEEGDGVTAFRGVHDPGNCQKERPCEQDFLSAMAYHNLWFWKNRFGFLLGGGFIRNPGRYLVLVPTGVAAATFDTRPGTEFFGWDVSSNLSVYPSDNLTVRLEVSHHEASVPYYAGPGGVTGPDGYKCGGLYSPDGTISTCAPSGWTPDLANAETKLILALLFRL